MAATSLSRDGWIRAAGAGAETGAALALAYALAFIGYAIVRSTLNLLAAPTPDAGQAATVLATWASLAVPALVLGALLALPAALLGALTALALRALVGNWGAVHTPRRALGVGVGVCLSLSLALVVALAQGSGVAWTPATAETLTFWLVLPLVIYVVAGSVASWHLGQRLAGNVRA